MSQHDCTRLGTCLIILGLALAITVTELPLVALAGLLAIRLGTWLWSRAAPSPTARKG